MKTALILLALVLATGGLTAQTPADTPAPLTLEQAISRVLARYPTLDAAQAAVDAAHAQTLQSDSARLPQVSVSGDYVYTTLRPYIPFGSTVFNETVQNIYNGEVTARQLLTDFGRTDALVSLARSGELSAADALEATRHQLGYETIQSFYGVLLLRESVAVADADIRALDEALRISTRKLNGGTATRFDVLTTQVRLADARNRRSDTVAALEKQQAQLRQLLGLAPDAAVELQGDFPASSPLPGLSESIAAGLRQRPEMKLALESSRAADLKIAAADRENRPVLSAVAAAGAQNNDLPDLYADKLYATGGLTLSVPLFTGRRITGERQQARAELRAAQARVHELDGTIATEVSDAQSDLRAAQARRQNADLLVDQADEALALARTRYANGVITNFELLDAESSDRGAQLTRLQARYDWALARQALARAMGDPPQP
jgi:outer membrane protein TolC